MNNGEGSPAATPTDIIATLVSERMQVRQPLVDRYTAPGVSAEDRAGALLDFQQQFRADATPWTNAYPQGMFTAGEAPTGPAPDDVVAQLGRTREQNLRHQAEEVKKAVQTSTPLPTPRPPAPSSDRNDTPLAAEMVARQYHLEVYGSKWPGRTAQTLQREYDLEYGARPAIDQSGKVKMKDLDGSVFYAQVKRKKDTTTPPQPGVPASQVDYSDHVVLPTPPSSTAPVEQQDQVQQTIPEAAAPPAPTEHLFTYDPAAVDTTIGYLTKEKGVRSMTAEEIARVQKMIEEYDGTDMTGVDVAIDEVLDEEREAPEHKLEPTPSTNPPTPAEQPWQFNADGVAQINETYNNLQILQFFDAYQVPNYYELLEVKQTASDDEIKKAVNTMLIRYNTGNYNSSIIPPQQRAQMDALCSYVRESLRSLLDPERRSNYNTWLTQPNISTILQVALDAERERAAVQKRQAATAAQPKSAAQQAKPAAAAKSPEPAKVQPPYELRLDPKLPLIDQIRTAFDGGSAQVNVALGPEDMQGLLPQIISQALQADKIKRYVSGLAFDEKKLELVMDGDQIKLDAEADLSTTEETPVVKKDNIPLKVSIALSMDDDGKLIVTQFKYDGRGPKGWAKVKLWKAGSPIVGINIDDTVMSADIEEKLQELLAGEGIPVDQTSFSFRNGKVQLVMKKNPKK